MLIVGLSNPGKKYLDTRHNAGAMLIDYLIKKHRDNNPEKFVRQREDRLYSCVAFGDDFVLCKSKIFMNNSGQAVCKIIKNFKLEIKNLAVAHDDLDIPLGKFKIQKGIGPKLHNGIKSVDQHLHTKDFWRIRIGIDNRSPEHRVDGERYTLQNFLPEEKEILNNVFSKIILNLKQPGLVI